MQEILRSRIRVKNSTDLVNSAYTSDDLIKNNESIPLRFERLRIMPFNGQCFAVAVPKDDVKRKIKKSTFSVTLDVNKTQCQLCKRLAGPFIPLSWSGKRVTLWMWSLGGSSNHFPVYWAIFGMVTNKRTNDNRVILVQACSWPAWEGGLLQ